MSVAKRSRVRQAEAIPLPASKRVKVTTSTHVPIKNGLEFLVHEDARAGRKLEAKTTNGVSNGHSNRVDESHAGVASEAKDEDGDGGINGTSHEIIDISSGEEESSAYDSEDQAGADLQLNGHAKMDAEDEDGLGAEPGATDDRNGDSNDAAVDDTADIEDGEPSFGDLLQARHPGPIDVHASLANGSADHSAMVPASSNVVRTVFSGTSLGTILTQALKTNDKDMLESCFGNTVDLPSIRSTIERLQSTLAVTLLQRLSERIHRAPGRTGKLMIWIQWTLVTHGGYLASQPAIMHTLKSLAQVVRERASGLQPLLHLKGKLDILSAQLDYRKKTQANSRIAGAEDDDDEEAVVYIEGQDEDWSEHEDITMGEEPKQILPRPAPKLNGGMATPRSDLPSDGDESDDEDMPNGVAQESEDDEEDNAEEEEEGLFDEEAEEDSADGDEEASSNGDASSVSGSEDESEASDDESEVEVKPAPLKTLNRKR
ncbi:hypothetical protein LTR62_004537 [Meristemomyces frigidus]|uniref:Small-subunit processome Utp12 domain-containing protein n=1 Tax=Meristemomyces frigidus TaxID=1508187 RepID=A0AAN7TH11_9PEZI|nr:hypothetical protein LTR62_004537 [Meristemomyces frigidus]